MEQLVANLRRYGELRSERVANVLLGLDRLKYCPPSTPTSETYADSPLPIGLGQTISGALALSPRTRFFHTHPSFPFHLTHSPLSSVRVRVAAPHMHAMCLELLENHLLRGTAALDVGSGSGYFTAAMALLGAAATDRATPLRVYGIDSQPGLVTFGRANIANDKPELLASGQVTLLCANGWTVTPATAEGGLPTAFDAIHVGAAAESVPSALTALLAPGGRMVIPVGPEHGNQRLITIDRSEDGNRLTETPLFSVRFVPLVRPFR